MCHLYLAINVVYIKQNKAQYLKEDKMKRILVVGSLNMDTVLEVPYLPRAGETITGKDITLIPGGKGANQAYAVGKLGGDVVMAGAIGDDSFGDRLRANLKEVGVNTTPIVEISGVPTGQAYIIVDDNGENSITLIRGANGEVTCKMAERWEKYIETCDILIMQLEIPLDTVLYVKNLAVRLGKIVILDPAPAKKEFPDGFWQGIDYIKPNETELSILTGKPIDTRENIINAASEMLDKGVKNVIVTLGEKGCFFVNRSIQKNFPAEKVKAVDTTAAGDCFTAAFALALSRGETEDEAINFGQKVSSIAVTRKGAQTSIPDASEL